MGVRRGAVASLVLAAALALAVAACGHGDGAVPVDEQVRSADDLLGRLGLRVTAPAHVVDSKSVRYVVAEATADGDSPAVVRALAGGLAAERWNVVAQRPLGDTGGDEVVATKDGLVVRLSVYDRLGTRPAPPGTRWVQLALAEPHDELGWTRT